MASPDLFATHFRRIKQITEKVVRRNTFTEQDAEDFRQTVFQKLLQDDQARLRSFTGRSSFETYLVVVVTNLARDFRNRLWGKWRPSARAQQEGPIAVRLEMLIHRDGCSLVEAVGQVIAESEDGVTEREVYACYSRLPVRLRRQMVGLDDAWNQGAGIPADALLLEEEHRREVERLNTLLEQGIGALAPDERLIVRLRFQEGFTLAEVARALSLKGPQRVHDRLKRALTKLRSRLEDQGVRLEDLADLLADERR